MDKRMTHRPRNVYAVVLVIAASFCALAQAQHHHDHSDGPSLSSDQPPDDNKAGKFGFFTNYGNYMPRIHCLQTTMGTPDWPWIGLLLGLHIAILIGYTKVFVFFRKCYVAEDFDDRNYKLWSLALLFLICAMCGYGMSMVMFFWPAYRLLGIMMIVLTAATWTFAWNLKPLEASFAARRVLRERRDVAEVANRSKSEFLANMSHEIRTPMTAILGFSEQLNDDQLSPKARQDAVETICRNGHYLLHIINDILDLSKIEAGKMTVETIPCNPSRLLADVVTMMRNRAEGKGLHITVDIGEQVPDAVLTDPVRLRQMLINLISNAVKFTEQGGIKVSTKYLVSEGAPSLQFDILDTGIGMGPTEVAQLFQAFSQADSSTTREFGGTGLGLTISKRLANLMGGDVELIDSRIGEGSLFRIRICAPVANDVTAVPMNPNAARAAKPPESISQSSAKPLSGYRILLAEDGHDNQKLISFVLKKAGAEFAIAENGRSAMEQALAAREAGKPFDAILMDMQMPEMDGYEATRELRTANYDGVIIALTAHAMAGDRQKCLDAGCDEYATKPIDRSALIECILTLHKEQNSNPAL